jgi:hypothetical protein
MIVVKFSVVVDMAFRSRAQVFDGFGQVPVRRLQLLDGDLEMTGQMFLAGGVSAASPGSKLKSVFGVVLQPMGQQQAQFFDVVHCLFSFCF